MIDFACKRFDIKEVIKCSLGLTKSEFVILNYLIKSKKESNLARDISKEVNLDLSTVQRSLKRLHGKKLIIRRQRNLSPGGYQFCYNIITKSDIKILITDIVNNWNRQVRNSLDEWADNQKSL